MNILCFVYSFTRVKVLTTTGSLFLIQELVNVSGDLNSMSHFSDALSGLEIFVYEIVVHLFLDVNQCA
jgi:hypothetical protein